LLARTTRSVAPTEAGDQLLAQAGPALGDIRTALDGVGRLRERPAGRLRLVMPRIAASMVLLPRLARFTREYPDVVLDVTTDNGPVDIVAARFDAGIEIGEFIQRDMIVVRVSADLRAAIVASPAYFKAHPRPASRRTSCSTAASAAGWDRPASTAGSSRGAARRSPSACPGRSCWTTST